MTVLYIILGILMIIGGFSCMFTPVATLLAAGYYMGILLLVYGIFGIIRAITEKGDALEWILNILAVIVGIFAFVKPGSTLVFDGLFILFLAAYFLIQGVIHIVLAFRFRKVTNNWIWSLISGILGVILGIYSFMHPRFAAITAGMLIGFLFVESGISMISLVFAAKELNNSPDEGE